MAKGSFQESTGYLFWKGRVALYAILKAMGIGVGDEVIVLGFTCVVVPQAVRFTGARPIYADVDESTLDLNPNQLSSLVTDRTRAIIVQHTFGLPSDVDSIKAIAAPKGIRIIEDCANTMASLYKSRKVGTLGDAAFFSTQWSKPITTGLGGIAVTNDAEIARRLEAFERQCIDPSFREALALSVQFRIHRVLFRPSLYWTALGVLHGLSRLGLFVSSSSSQELNGEKPKGYEKRMGAFQAKALKTAMAEVEANWAHRRYVTARYAEAIKRMGLQTITFPEGTQPVMLRYPVLVSNKEKVLKEARRRRIEIGDWFVSPLHPLTEGLEGLEYKWGECPVAESVARRVINLPTHPKVDDRTIARTCEFLESMERGG